MRLPTDWHATLYGDGRWYKMDLAIQKAAGYRTSLQDWRSQHAFGSNLHLSQAVDCVETLVHVL